MKMRIPLPKKTEKIHRDKKKQYNRQEAKKIDLPEKGHTIGN